MAEATLSNVTKALADSNRDQVKAQKDTTAAVASLTKSMKAFLEQGELDRKRQLEADIEARRAATRSSAGSSSSSGGSSDSSTRRMFLAGLPGAGLIAAVGGAVATLTATMAGFVAATEGLGPNMKDLRRLKGAFTSYTRFLKNTMAAFKLPAWAKADKGAKALRMFDNIPANMKAIDKLIGDKYKFDPKSNRFVDAISKKYVGFANVTKYVEDLGKNLKAVEDGLPNNAANLAANAELTKGIGKEGFISKAMQALKDNKWLKTFLKVLRPIAVILSVFDGVGEAQAEMEDREGKMDKWIGGGLGGFLSGALSSFFGEMLDFIKAIPGYIIKQFVPAAWLNADGTFNDTNAFTSFMAGFEDFSFTTIIKDIIQYPFDMLGKSLDFIRNLFGATGTTEEGQAGAKKAWDDWWSQSPLNMGKSILGTLANIVFSPINAVINELKKVFGIGAEADDQKLGFMENVNQLMEYVYGLIPSVEDIKKSLAAGIGPGKIVDLLGLTNYLPITPEEYNKQFKNLVIDAHEYSKKMKTLTTVQNNQDPLNAEATYFNNMALDTLNAEQTRLADEYAALVARGADAGISSTVPTTYNQTVETFLFPNGGTDDKNDNVLRITIRPGME